MVSWLLLGVALLLLAKRGPAGRHRTAASTPPSRRPGLPVIASVLTLLTIAVIAGRIGLVLPGGIVSDGGSAALRRHLFDRAEVDSIDGLDNRAAFFPIHRSLRFVLLTATSGRPTTAIACRFGITDPAGLESEHSLPDPQRGSARAAPLVLSRRLLERLTLRGSGCNAARSAPS